MTPQLLEKFVPDVRSGPLQGPPPMLKFEPVNLDAVAPTPGQQAPPLKFEPVDLSAFAQKQAEPEPESVTTGEIGGFFGPVERGFNRLFYNDTASLLENFGARETAKQLIKEGQEQDFARATGKYAQPMRSVIDDPFGFLEDALDLKRIHQAVGENLPLMGAIVVTGLLAGGATLALTKNPTAAMWVGRAGSGLLYGLLERGSFISEANDYEEATGKRIDPLIKHGVGTVVGAFNAVLGMSGLESILKTVTIPGFKGRLLHTLLAGSVEGITEMSEELTQALGSSTYRNIPWRDTLIQMQEALYMGLTTGTGASVALAPFGGERKATEVPPPVTPSVTAEEAMTAEGQAIAREQEQLKALNEMSQPVNEAGKEAVAQVRKVAEAKSEAILHKAAIEGKPIGALSDEELEAVKAVKFEEVPTETVTSAAPTLSPEALKYLPKATSEYKFKPLYKKFFGSPQELAEAWADADRAVSSELTQRAVNEQSSFQNEMNLTPAIEVPPAQLTTKPLKRRGRPEARTYDKVADELESRMDEVVKSGGDVLTDPVYQQLSAEADALLDAEFKRRIAAKVALDKKPEEQAVHDIVQARAARMELSLLEQLDALDDEITANHTHLKEVDIHLKELNDADKLTTPIVHALDKLWAKAEHSNLMTAELDKRLNEVSAHLVEQFKMLGEARRRIEAEQARADIITPPKSVGRELSAYDKMVAEAEKKAGRKLTGPELKALATELLAQFEEPTTEQAKEGESTANDIADIEKAIAEGKVQLQIGAYHGSPSQRAITKFETSRIGSTGGTAFGWGFYFSSLKDVADYYKNLLRSPGLTYKVTLFKGKNEGSYDLIDWYNEPNKSQTAKLDKAFSTYGTTTKNAIINFARAAVQTMQYAVDSAPILQVIANPKSNTVTDNLVTAFRNKAAVVVRSKFFSVVLGANKAFSIHQAKQVLNEQFDPLYKRFDSIIDTGKFTVKDAYEILASLTGSQQNASKVLLKSGIDGIRYPVGSLIGMEGYKNDYNYVIFDPAVITIEDTTRFQVGSAQLDPVAQKAQEIFGVTDNIDKAGFITLDGKMIDLSQDTKHKTLHHGAVKKAYDAAGVDPVGRAREVFIADGNVRITFSDYSWGLIDLKVEPNVRQYARIGSLLEQAFARGQRVDIEMQNGERVDVLEVTPDDDIRSIFNKIKMFYAGTRDTSLLNFLQDQAKAIQRAERPTLTEAQQAPIVQRLKQLFPFLKFDGATLPLIASRNQQVFGANLDHTISWRANGASDDTIPHEATHDLMLILLANNDPVALKGLELAGSMEQLVQWVGEEYAKRNAGELAYVSSRTQRLRQWLREFWSRVKEVFLSARLTQEDIRNILGEAFFKGNILERVGLNAADVTREDLYASDYALKDLIPNDPDSIERRQAIQDIANAQDPSLRSLDGIARQLGIPVDEVRKAQFQVGQRQVMENNPGFKVTETLSDGKAIYDEVRPNDVSPFASYFGSPEYQALRKGFVRAADLIGKVIEQSLLHMFKHRQDVAGFDTFRHGKGKVEHPERLRKAVQMVYDHKAEQIEDFNLRLAAEGLVTYFKEIKDAYIKSRIEILEYKTAARNKPWLVEALSRLQEGAEPTKLVEELGLKNKRDIKSLAALYQRLTDIRHWGIDKFITNIEPGRFAVVDFTGSIIAVSETHEGAVAKAKEFLSKPGQLIEEVMDDKGNVKLVKNEFEELEVAISTDIRPPSPDKGRLNALKGRDNLLEVMDIYSARMRKAIALDPIYERIKYEMEKYPEEFPQHVAGMMRNLMRDARGHYWRGDQILDAFLDKRLPKLSATINKEGMAYTRAITSVRGVTVNVKLGYRAIAPIINFLGGTFQHTLVKTGAIKLAQAASFIRTAEGKQLIKDEELYLGRGRIIEEMKYAYEKVSLWKPLGLFQAAEKLNVELGYAANYLMAREMKKADGSLFTEAESREFARRAIRFQQFVYNIAALPAILRSPTGRLIGQFKTYLVKEIEFISSLRGVEIPRYVGTMLMISGLRGVTYAVKTLPFIWLLGGLLDEGDKWLNSMPKEAGWFARTMLAFAQRGVPGTLGGDITAPAVIQLPDRPEEWAGPFIGDVIALFGDVIKPAFQGEGYSLQDFGQLAKYRVPALNYYWQVMDTYFGENKIYDQNGKPIYEASNWDRFLLALGVTPADKSREDAIVRLNANEEATRRQRVIKAQNAFFAYILKRRSVGDVISWLSSDSFNDVVADLVAAGAVGSLEANAQFRFLNRREQEIIRARVLKRPDVIQMWPSQQFPQ